jgi:hypothetical protein
MRCLGCGWMNNGGIGDCAHCGSPLVKQLRRLRLLAVSLVASPANPHAQVAITKSAEEPIVLWTRKEEIKKENKPMNTNTTTAGDRLHELAMIDVKKGAAYHEALSAAIAARPDLYALYRAESLRPKPAVVPAPAVTKTAHPAADLVSAKAKAKVLECRTDPSAAPLTYQDAVTAVLREDAQLYSQYRSEATVGVEAGSE